MGEKRDSGEGQAGGKKPTFGKKKMRIVGKPKRSIQVNPYWDQGNMATAKKSLT